MLTCTPRWRDVGIPRDLEPILNLIQPEEKTGLFLRFVQTRKFIIARSNRSVAMFAPRMNAHGNCPPRFVKFTRDTRVNCWGTRNPRTILLDYLRFIGSTRNVELEETILYNLIFTRAEIVIFFWRSVRFSLFPTYIVVEKTYRASSVHVHSRLKVFWNIVRL